MGRNCGNRGSREDSLSYEYTHRQLVFSPLDVREDDPKARSGHSSRGLFRRPATAGSYPSSPVAIPDILVTPNGIPVAQPTRRSHKFVSKYQGLLVAAAGLGSRRSRTL